MLFRSIPYGASVKVCFELINLVADKFELEAGHRNVGGSADGATTYTAAVLPSHCLGDIFVRACRTACANCLVGVILKHVYVEVAPREVKREIIDTERPPRVPGHVVFIDL